MPAVFEAGYEDNVPGALSAAEARCKAVCAALAAAGITAAIEYDPPWMDAGNLSGYFQDCAWGNVFVTVAAADAERAQAVVEEQKN